MYNIFFAFQENLKLSEKVKSFIIIFFLFF